MKNHELSDATVRVIRIIAISSGCLLLLAAMLSNIIGLSTSAGLSLNQVYFAVAGIILVISGFLGRRFPGFYSGTAKILLNIVIAVVLVEFLSLALVKVIDSDRFNIRARKIEEGHLDELEHMVVCGRYAPFVVWRSNPIINCDSITISEDGYRLTPGASPSRDGDGDGDGDGGGDAFKIFMLGGSAMWGAGVSDSCTIGAYLQRDLSELSDRPVAVHNLAQVGHSSTQELIELMLQLRNGNIPDLVIFYDGFNDVCCSYENGVAGVHASMGPISGRVEGTAKALGILPVWEILLSKTNMWLLITSLQTKGILPEETQEVPTYRTMGVDCDSLTSEIVSIYYGNCRVVEALADSYGFDYLIVWQPTIWSGDRHLTDQEKEYVEVEDPFFPWGADPAFRELLEASYDLYEESITDSTRYFSFRDIFDGIEYEVYIDYSGSHITARANEMIADTLVRMILETDILLSNDITISDN